MLKTRPRVKRVGLSKVFLSREAAVFVFLVLKRGLGFRVEGVLPLWASWVYRVLKRGV